MAIQILINYINLKLEFEIDLTFFTKNNTIILINWKISKKGEKEVASQTNACENKMFSV